MQDVLLGKQRGLVFPVMCNGAVVIDYSDNIPDSADDVGYGLWSNEGSFTLEAIVTPYDINGYAKISSNTQPTITASKRIMPSNGHQSTPSDYQSHLYLTDTDRLTHEMTIFSNVNASNEIVFWFGLVNETLHNENQPARYKLKLRMRIDGTLEEFETGVCIEPNYFKRFIYDSSVNNLNGFNRQSMVGYEQIGTVSSHSGATITGTFTTTKLFNGGRLEAFYRSGLDYISLGTINTATTTEINLSNSYSTTLSNTTEIFIRSSVEPLYINELFHVACVFDNVAKAISIYLNGNRLLNQNLTNTATFTFADTDCKIGQCFSYVGTTSAKQNKQFMGEIHELSLMNVVRNTFLGKFNLLPNYENTLLYLRFEEADL